MATATKFKIESGIQLLARLSKKPGVINFFPTLFDPGLKHGETVEMYNDVNISYLLIDMICEALLPRESKEPIGVLMINTAGQFNYEEFIKILRKRLFSTLDKENNEMPNFEIDQLLDEVLSNYHLLEVYDATQFYTTIHSLDKFFIKHSNLSLVIIDTLTAFYWSEQGFKVTKMDLYIKSLLTMIQKVTKEYKIIIVYTKSKYFSSSKDTDNFEYSISDGVNFKVKLSHIGKSLYEVNVKSSQTYYKNFYSIVNNEINWT